MWGSTDPWPFLFSHTLYIKSGKIFFRKICANYDVSLKNNVCATDATYSQILLTLINSLISVEYNF